MKALSFSAESYLPDVPNPNLGAALATFSKFPTYSPGPGMYLVFDISREDLLLVPNFTLGIDVFGRPSY